ncbi:hypothetical protein OGATHE_005018 [Ogataea polymorpha]|uniref:Uncharacterized protein n=1 Tax=Ogataea polymorpha TaxID=460523 RepID=A0A9P8NWU6_9ASCO|nr:hypothetical protein OGATHE_005018 [Ogataea polymorpha]
MHHHKFLKKQSGILELVHAQILSVPSRSPSGQSQTVHTASTGQNRTALHVELSRTLFFSGLGTPAAPPSPESGSWLAAQVSASSRTPQPSAEMPRPAAQQTWVPQTC